MKHKIWVVLAAAMILRLIPALFGVVTADIKFHMAYALQFMHMHGSFLNLYGAVKALYHNTPIWLLVVTLTLMAAAKLSISFAILIKIWPIIADIGIIILLFRFYGSVRFAWLYALNPVSILVTGFHGQFDPVVMFFVLWSIILLVKNASRNSFYASSLLLGLAIALKGFPVLLLPFVFLFAKRENLHWQCLAIALLPAFLASLPFAMYDTRNFFEALLLYSGSSDFGTGGIYRLVSWAIGGFSGIAPFGNVSNISFLIGKLIFFAYYFLLLKRFNEHRENIPYYALAVYAGFISIYPGISAQYFLWLIPLMIIASGQSLWAYSFVTAAAMCCFYITYFPRVLAGRMDLRGTPMWVPHFAAIGYLALNVAQWVMLIFVLRQILRPKEI